MDQSLNPSLSRQADFEVYRRHISLMPVTVLRDHLEKMAEQAMVVMPAAVRYGVEEALSWADENRQLRLALREQRLADAWDEAELTG